MTVSLRCTLYYTALEGDYPSGTDAAFKTRDGSVIKYVSAEFLKKAAIEGSAELSDGRTVNVDGKVDGERRWKVVPHRYGLDAVGCPLIPFRSFAVDPAVISIKTILHIPETVGMPLPDSFLHDGRWYAVDTGSSIGADRIDLFVGAGKATMEIAYDFGLSHLKPLTVKRLGTLTGCTPA